MQNRPGNTYAFIDANNLHQGVKSLGWEIDYEKLRRYLTDKFSVTRAWLFLGYDPRYERLYAALSRAGFQLVFKPLLRLADGTVKGNCDGEMILRAALELPKYDQAVIVTGDGDFHCLVAHLASVGKLKRVLAPTFRGCSSLLKESFWRYLDFAENLRPKIEYKRKRSP